MPARSQNILTPSVRASIIALCSSVHRSDLTRTTSTAPGNCSRNPVTSHAMTKTRRNRHRTVPRAELARMCRVPHVNTVASSLLVAPVGRRAAVRDRKLLLTANEEIAEGHPMPALQALLYEEKLSRTSTPCPMLPDVHRAEADIRSRPLQILYQILPLWEFAACACRRAAPR